jgi:hypothetical protein
MDGHICTMQPLMEVNQCSTGLSPKAFDLMLNLMTEALSLI